HALALGLAPDRKTLSFPELPRAARPVADTAPTTVRTARRLAAADEAGHVPLTLVPSAPVAASVFVAAPAGPLVTTSDRWEDEPTIQPPDEPGAPMGLNMEQTDQPDLEPRPGPGALFPKLLSVVLPIWLLWAVWSFSGRLAKRITRSA
ncbi:MAG: hypothetical protein ACR2IK_16480, partial [Chloroflexota bacterium]